MIYNLGDWVVFKGSGKNLVGACFACNKQRSKNWMEINIQQFALEK